MANLLDSVQTLAICWMILSASVFADESNPNSNQPVAQGGPAGTPQPQVLPSNER